MSSKFLGSQTMVRTPIGELPADWEVRQLGENAHIKARIGWRGLSADEYTKDGPLLVAGKHIRGARIDWGSCDHISEFRYDESPEIQLQNDDVILSKDGTLGRIGIVERLPRKATINGTMMLVRPDNGVLKSQFLYYCLQGRYFRKFIKEKVSGSSVPHIFQRDMVRLLVPVPPLPEQRKIAAILSSVDDAIEKTQVVIDQVQVVKRGLMQQLLTRGLPGRHTRFKQTEIGEIPEEWRTNRIGEIASCDYGTSDTLRSDRRGIPILRMGNLVDGKVRMNNVKYLGAERVPDRLFLSGGDVLFNRTNSAELVGKVAVFDHIARVSFASYLLRLRVEPQVGSGFWLSYLLNTTTLQRRLRATATVGVSQVNINRKSLLATVVQVPPIEEQEAIVSILNSVSHMVEIEQERMDRFATLKSALMSVLLTGELRVTPDPETS